MHTLHKLHTCFKPMVRGSIQELEATHATEANASELDRLARQSPDLQPQKVLKDIAESRRL